MKKICLALLALVIGVSISAEVIAEQVDEKKPQEDWSRPFVLDAKHPWDDGQANSDLWFTMTEAIGKGSDQMVKSKLGSSMLGRGAIVVIDFPFQFFTEYLSHETAHMRDMRKHDHVMFSLDFSVAFSDIHNLIMYKSIHPESQETFEASLVAGINQDEYNGLNLMAKKKFAITFDEGSSYLLNKFYDELYIVFSDKADMGQLTYAGGQISKKVPAGTVSGTYASGIDDVAGYLFMLGQKGIHLSYSDFLKQTLLADLLTMATYDSFSSIYRFVAYGQRTTSTTAFRIGEARVVAPIVNTFFTPRGTFYSSTTYVVFDDRREAEINLGFDADFIGDGDVDTLRLGGKYMVNLGSFKEVSFRGGPSAYISRQRSNWNVGKGWTVGAETAVDLTPTSSILIKALYDKDDIVEWVLGRDNGMNYFAGLTFRY